MKNIVVLVDYTEGCKVALDQTRVIAELTGANVHALHVTSGAPDAGEHARLQDFSTTALGGKLAVTTHLANGDLMDELPRSLLVLNPDLIILCTHGIKGILQKMFGARILKLVQSVQLPFLVVHENTEVKDDGFGKILFPATPSPHASVKIEQTAQLAAETDSEVIFYEIDKYIGDSNEAIQANFDAAKKLFKSRGIKWSHVKEESTSMSLGFARQTLEYASKHQVGAISMLSEIADHGMVMIKADKESMLTNAAGIPVLSCA